MTRSELQSRQAPLKETYRSDPDAAVVRLHAEGRLGDGLTCHVPSQADGATTVAGLHPATGGDGGTACSGDMLLEAVVACAGVTMQAVATSMRVEIHSGTLRAEADWDARGTLAVDRDAPVGLTNLHLHATLHTSADPDTLSTLMRLTERYCVVLQTLLHAPDTHATIEAVEA